MTLLICAFTEDHAILASDRRLAVETSSGMVIPREEDACKMVYFNGRFVFAYTGPSVLGEKLTKTDLWIVKSLQESDPSWNISETLDYIMMKLQVAISMFRAERLQYITIVCVGWSKFDGGSEYEPCFGIVSTYIDCHLNNVPLEKRKERVAVYYSVRKVFPNNIPFLFYAGQNIKRDRQVYLRRSFENFSARKLGQNIPINYLYKEIVEASRSNPWIGRGVLAAAISKESVSRMDKDGSAFLIHGGEGFGQQFQYYPANSSQSFFRGPHAVMSGGSSAINFKGGYR